MDIALAQGRIQNEIVVRDHSLLGYCNGVMEGDSRPFDPSVTNGNLHIADFYWPDVFNCDLVHLNN